MKLPKACLLIVTLLLSLLTSSCMFTCCCFPTVWHSEEEDRQVQAAGIERISVESHNGSITLVSHDQAGHIQIHLKKRGGGRTELDAAECLKNIEITSEVEGDHLQLGWKWTYPKESQWSGSVAFDIRLPSSITVSALSHNGQIVVDGMISPATITTHNGRIAVRNHENDLKAETHNGRIEVDAFTKDLDLLTHNGGITVELNEVPIIDGVIRTHNGSISLRIHGDPDSRIVCSTDNGGISVSKPMRTRVSKKHYFEGIMGQGEEAKGRITVDTHNGSITVK